jgi:hypothetical protein
MNQFKLCSQCDGFIPNVLHACRHCGTQPSSGVARVAAGAALTVAGIATALTLMACYGPAPCPGGGSACYYAPDASTTDAADGASPADAETATRDSGH